MPSDTERKAKIAQLEAELQAAEYRYDRVENMGSMSDLEHTLAKKIGWLSEQIDKLKQMESEPPA